MNDNLVAHLLAGADPERIALAFAGGEEWTYRDLFAHAARLAERLLAHDVQPGDRVAVQADKGPEVIALYLAVLAVGGVYLPLNDAYTDAELDYFIGDAEPRLFVASSRRAAGIEALADGTSTRVQTLEALAASVVLDVAGTETDVLTPVARTRDDLAAILYTSGTTGRSKGAMLTHGNLCSNAVSLAEAWRFTPDDVLLHALPIFHIHGLFVACNVTLLAGGTLRMLPRFEASAVLDALPQASVMMGVPTFYTRLLAEPGLNADAVRSIRLFVSGSAPLLAETHREWEARTGHRILERYGMTETGMNTSNPYDGERRPGTVGTPLPGVEVHIVDDQTDERMPAGGVGMIEVRGPNVFRGYWRMPDKTAAELHADGFFVTGDVGRLSEDGYLEIVGREKDLIISGGLNVYPKEVETAIDALPGVVESAVIGLPHADFGEAVTAVIVREPGSDLAEADVVRTLKTHLAGFKVPKSVHFVDELPRNTMGKVQKNLLRERFA